METFKYGDKVTHPLHGKGKVGNSFPAVNLVTVYFENDRDSKRFGTSVHPVSLTKIPTPIFEVRIEWEGGAVTYSGPLDNSEVKRYLSCLELDNMTGYTVTRLGSK